MYRKGENVEWIKLKGLNFRFCIFTKILLMSALQLQAYDMLKLKLGEQEAKLFISYIENQVEQDVKNENKSIMAKLDSFATKEDLSKSIADVKSDLSSKIYVVGLVQFLAIVSAVIGVMSFLLHK